MEFVPRQSTLTIGTSVVEVSPETGVKERELVALSNNSPGVQVIYLAWGQDAAVNNGVVLRPGSAWVESIDKAFNPSNLRITAVASAAGAILTIHERLR
jgi:hypothetical protein